MTILETNELSEEAAAGEHGLDAAPPAPLTKPAYAPPSFVPKLLVPLWEAIDPRAATGHGPLFPLAVLALIFFFDEFDTAAFALLAPEIKRAFHMTDQGFTAVVVLNSLVLVLLAIPVGYYGDRFSRRLIVVVSAIVAGAFSLATGLVTTVAVLTLVRIGNGIGRLANDPIHSSILADVYEPENRPRVFGFHRNAVHIGAIIGPLVAGGIASLFGWRPAFMVLIVPVVIVAIVALRLPDPKRGATDDARAADELEDEAPVPFKQASRMLMSVRTLKRQYISYIFFGMGVVPLAIYLPLYLDEVYHLGPGRRSFINAGNAIATFIGITVASRKTQKWLGKGLGEPLKPAGLALVLVGPGLLLVAVSPFLALAIVLGFATSFAAGFYLPPFLTVQALVSPARVRSFSFSYGALFSLVGAFIFLVTPLGRLADNHNVRWGVGATAPWFVIGGLILASARRFVTADTEKAFKVLTTSVELRRERLAAGERSLLKCAGVDVAYSGVQVLFGVDFEVKEGEIVALLGTNGAGKSTLLKAISGLVDPAGGAVFFDGQDVTHLDARGSAQLGIVQMPGGRSVFPTMTVNECLRLAGWLYKRDRAHVEQATAQVLDYFPILRDRGDQLAGNLSGGEQQMLGLGMAFISKPKLLMIDELSLGLAPTIVGQLCEIVRRIHDQGTTIILVEQSVNVALTLAQRAVFMEKGEVRFTGPTADLLQRDDILRSVFLEGAAVGAGAAAKRAPAAGVTAATAARKGPEQFEGTRVRLELDDVSRRFGGITAVDGVSLTLHEGEILGLIGPNGAGKTTLFDLISGFLPVDDGRIVFEGHDVTNDSAARRAMAGLGRSFQDARIFPSLTVAENIAMGLERHLEVRDPFAAALALPAVNESEEEVAWTVHELIELLGLGAFRNKFVGELSTGSRRIVDLAMAIAHKPTVLLLDEPSSGIAQRETEALGPLLKRIQAEVGCSMLVIEHDMPLITGVSDTMIALELGGVIATGSPQEVVNHPRVVASYLGTDEAAISRSGSLSPDPSDSRSPDPSDSRPPDPSELSEDSRRPDDADPQQAPAARPRGAARKTNGAAKKTNGAAKKMAPAKKTNGAAKKVAPAKKTTGAAKAAPSSEATARRGRRAGGGA
ncbi:MAG TPA: MFS transporter [Acidimicrobiales bacterium]|nr:MFS transporter [Acidimicrobiales bacterium]